jgi:D-psicose/D-tagatose/L-ribulose 3-epimerase
MKKMLIGAHTLQYAFALTEKELGLVSHLKELGCETIEFCPLDLESFPAAKFQRAALDAGFKNWSMGYGMPRDCNIISPDPEERRKGIEQSKLLIDKAMELDASVLGGMMYAGWGYTTGHMPTQEEWNLAVEYFSEIAVYSWKQNPGLVLGIEPVQRGESHFINTLGRARQFALEFARRGVPVVKVHADSFHMIREEDSFRDALLEAGAYLRHFHACENQRGIPGTGLVPWPELMKALRCIGYSGSMIIESFDPEMEEIAAQTQMWRKFASPDQLVSEGLRFLKGLRQAYYPESCPD